MADRHGKPVGPNKGDSDVLYLCPCCERPTEPRSRLISESECLQASAIMMARGWTAKRLIAKRSKDLDAIAPGMIDFLKRMVADREVSK